MRFTQKEAEQEAWTLTFSGKRLCALNPTPDAICLTDIAVSLSRQCRWNNQVHTWYSVAQHSVYVCELVRKSYPQLALAALMHDASEAYLADIPSPMKAQLADYKALEARFMAAIAQRFGFEWPLPGVIKRADTIALAHESRDLFDPPRLWLFPAETGLVDILPPLEPLDAAKACIAFTKTFDSLINF